MIQVRVSILFEIVNNTTEKVLSYLKLFIPRRIGQGKLSSGTL